MKNGYVITLGLLLGIAGFVAGCEYFPNLVKFNGSTPSISSEGESRSLSSFERDQNRAADSSAVLPPSKIAAKLINSQTLRPVSHAVVYHNGRVWGVDSGGRFEISAYRPKEPVLIKASGYKRVSIFNMDQPEATVSLIPFQARGLYLTHYGVGSKILRDGVLSIIREGKLNAIVIDVKGDRGYLSSKYPIPLAEEIGANRIPTMKDAKHFIDQLHEQNIYVIGRIVVFKDDLLSSAHPEWAVIDSRTSKPWRDNEKLGWVDPFKREVWDYNIVLAVEAARAGFDEIQFDYVRFPAGGKNSSAQFSQPNTMENRTGTIRGFLEAANHELLPYNVYFAADIFGYVPWNFDDTNIGQKITEVAGALDYICLMLYPSGFHLGIPGYRSPVKNPREVVFLTLEKAKNRLQGQSEKLRPWLQNFKDYAFDRRVFAGPQIQLQIKACEDSGTSGWLLWDPANRYQHTLDALTLLSHSPQMAQAGHKAEENPASGNASQTEYFLKE